MEDLLYSVKLQESILLNYFTRHLQKLVKFGHHRKKWELILLLNWESRVDLQCPENTV